MSITASRPNSRPSFRRHGIPPPPQATAIAPDASTARTAASSTTSSGRGEGTTRRHPRPFAVGSIAQTFEDYPNVGTLLPAMGYGREQMDDLRETISRSDADLVLIGTPIDLRRLIELDKPALRVTYRLQELEPALAEILAERGITETALV